MNTSVLEGTHQSLEVLSDRIAAILRVQDDVSEPANPKWSVRDTAAHLIATMGFYTEIASGTLSEVGVFTPEAVGEANAARIADIAESDPQALATMLTVATERFVDATKGRPDEDPVLYYDHNPLQLAHISGILTGEFLLHGFDIATACQVPWTIDPGQASLALFGLGAVFDRLANPATSSGHTGSYLVDLGPDLKLTVRFADGRLSIEPPGPADCEIGSDPVSWLMLCMGRVSQAQAVALGVVRFNGANPDLAAAFLNKLYSF